MNSRPAQVEGAQVVVQNYTLRHSVDVVRGRDIPGAFCAVQSGHIHRAQMVRRDLGGRPIAAPVLYPASIERTSFDERDEEKGYQVLDVGLSDHTAGCLVDVKSVPLAARPMVSLAVEPEKLGRQPLAAMDPEAVVRVQVQGRPSAADWQVLRAVSLRALAPATMNISLMPERGAFGPG